MTRVPIHFPLGGVSDDQAFSQQEQGTTSDSDNVVGIDPITGRVRGGQREGMSKHVTLPLNGTNKVQDLVVVTRDTPKTVWANVVPPTVVEWVRQTAEGSTVHWVALNVSEDVYILDGGGTITKYNSDGVKLRTIPIPSPQGHTVVKRIAVDADGGVYAASANATNTEGRIWRFRDSNVNGLELDLAWEHKITGAGVEIFASGAFFLVAVIVHSTGDQNRSMIRLDSIITGTPQETIVADVPGPVHDIDVDIDGAVKLAVGAGTAKGSSPDRPAFTKGGESWTLMDLHNATERIYCNLDASNIDGEGNTTLTDGDEITRWEDTKDSTVLDQTPRFLARDSAATPRPGPVFRKNVFGDLPGVRFIASTPTSSTGTLTGVALRSGGNGNATDKVTTSDALPAQRAIFPGTTNARFMTFIVFKPGSSQKQSILFSQPDAAVPGQDWGMFWNSTHSTGFAPTSPLWAQNSGLLHQKSGVAITGGAFNGSAASSQPTAFTSSNVVVLTIIHNQAGKTEESAIRVNGVGVDVFTFNSSLSHNSGSDGASTLFGCRRRTVNQNANDLYVDLDTYAGADSVLAALESFDGDIAQIVTVWADASTANTPYDVRIAVPNIYSGTPTTVSGTTGPWAAARDSDGISEVELIEGYLAHRWRVADSFPNGFSALQNPQSDHPFGGTGHWPVSPTASLDSELALRELWHPDPVLARYLPATSGLSWAISGGGMGYAVATSETGAMFTLGARVNDYGPDNQRQGAGTVIRRMVVDSGDRISMDTAARGFIRFKFRQLAWAVNKDEANPADGTTVTIGAEVFEFDNNATVTGGNTAVTIVGSAPGATMGNLVTAINASVLGATMTARLSGSLTVSLIYDSVGSAGNTIIATSHPTQIAVFSLAGGETVTNTWVGTSATDPSLPGVGVAIDEEGDVWVPELNDVLKYAKLDGTLITTYSVNVLQTVPCVALPLSHPAYIDQTPTPTGPVFMYLGTSGGELDPQLETLHKIRLISETQLLAGATTPRATRTLAVSGGNIYELTAPTASIVNGATLITDSPYIFSTELFNKVYWCDGAGYVVYDSQLNTLEKMVSKAAGSLPTNGRLIESWRGRLLIARTEDDPHNAYMSRIGDPFNWDEFPVIADSLEAVSLGGSRVGRSADIINGMIPYNDDLLIIGGDHTIQRLNGDPNAGGQLDLISDITGMAYGRAWAKDPEGRVYFFGSRGGVYMMAPGGIPTRITRDRIERRMADVDLSMNQIRMTWDYRREGLRVAVVPSGQPTAGAVPASGGWFLDKAGAWWPYSQVRVDEAPTAVAVLDGDLPADRVVLIGGGDGVVRKIDETALNDDGQRIASHVLIGPLAPSEIQGQLKFLRPQVTLGSLQGGCDFEWYASDTAELPGLPVDSGRLAPGQNPTLPVRARGKFVWLRLSNAAIDERWAFERASVDVVSGGRERVR